MPNLYALRRCEKTAWGREILAGGRGGRGGVESGFFGLLCSPRFPAPGEQKKKTAEYIAPRRPMFRGREFKEIGDFRRLQAARRVRFLAEDD